SPELEDEVFHHIQPGLSAYPDDADAAARSLDELLKVALDNVPEELQHCTPIAVKATAGLRLLGQEKSALILKAVHYHLETNYPFPIIEEDGVVIMDGKDEEKLQTAAIFDLGGGSTQIVFEPEMTVGEEVADGEHKYELEYGAIKNFAVNMWRDQKIDSIDVDSEHIPSKDHVPHPCFPKNYTETWSLPNLSDEDTTTLIGTGAGHAQCMPSEFSIKELRDLTDDVCAGNINQFEHLPEAMKELRKNPHYCMDLSFIYGLLHIGYEIPLEREVKMAKKIKGIETGWCLGAAISILDQKQWCKP
ncbi:8001_t:CDS:2, partial [Racocetra fulgida]